MLGFELTYISIMSYSIKCVTKIIREKMVNRLKAARKSEAERRRWKKFDVYFIVNGSIFLYN